MRVFLPFLQGIRGLKSTYKIWRVGCSASETKNTSTMEAVRMYTGDADAQYCHGDGFQTPAVYIANGNEWHIIEIPGKLED